jgi:hypothetical protein
MNYVDFLHVSNNRSTALPCNLGKKATSNDISYSFLNVLKKQSKPPNDNAEIVDDC